MAENKMTKEVLKAAKGTRSVEELQKLAKENGMELDAAQAEEMYARLHPVTQELSDDELDNVTGGDSCDVGYSCPKCGSMKRPEKEPSLIRGSIATPSLVAGIMNAKYVNGMPLARQEREFARYDLDLSTKTMANWIINCADRYLKPLYQLMKEELKKYENIDRK